MDTQSKQDGVESGRSFDEHTGTLTHPIHICTSSMQPQTQTQTQHYIPIWNSDNEQTRDPTMHDPFLSLAAPGITQGDIAFSWYLSTFYGW